MKIELLVSRCGADGAQNRGDVIEVSDADGARMIEAGQAIPARCVRVETTAKETKAEKTAKAPRKGRARS